MSTVFVCLFVFVHYPVLQLQLQQYPRFLCLFVFVFVYYPVLQLQLQQCLQRGTAAAEQLWSTGYIACSLYSL